VKGLEPEIQRLIAKHKAELKKVKQIQEAELLESDERAAQKYVRRTEELRDQLAACARERELAKQRWVPAGQQIRSKIDSFQNANFLFLNQTLCCYHSLESSQRDDFNEGHTIGFG